MKWNDSHPDQTLESVASLPVRFGSAVGISKGYIIIGADYENIGTNN